MRLARISELLTLAAIAAAGSMVAMKTEASAAEAGALLPVMSCEALANSDFSALDARIASSATATRNGHPFCDVKGYISPVTQFEALLPTESWRGDYLQQGCGGLCGKADVSLDDPSRTSAYQAPTRHCKMARWSSRRTIKAMRRRATATRSGPETTSA
jgi:feruloyl esterase